MFPTPDFSMACWIWLRNSNCCSASSNCPCISWQRIIPVIYLNILLQIHLSGQACTLFFRINFPQPLHKLASEKKEQMKTYSNADFMYLEIPSIDDTRLVCEHTQRYKAVWWKELIPYITKFKTVHLQLD